MSEEEEDSSGTTKPPLRKGLVSPGRLFGLTDGIFAISITLLALDVRVPEAVGDGLEGFREGRSDLYGAFGVFLLAFWITSRFWLANHAAMSQVHHVDRGLLSRTVTFLFGICSLPVAASLLVRFGSAPEAISFACLVLALTWLLSARLWWYLSDPANGLSDDDPRTRLDRLVDNLFNAATFLLVIPVAYVLYALDISPAWAMFTLVLLRFDRLVVRAVNRVVRR